MSTKKVSIIGEIMKDKPHVTTQDEIEIHEIQNANDRKILILGYDPDNKGPKFGSRHVQLTLMFLCMTIGFAMRTNLSVSIVAMTNKTTSPNPAVPAYDWTNTSVILSSFYWGYVFLQIFAGYFGKTYGIKYFLGPAFLINSVAFMFIPLAADRLGSIGVMICRVIQGLFQGFMYPSGHTMLGKWAPVEEMSVSTTFVYTGVNCGAILSSIITGFLSSSTLGWPSSFYIFGSFGIAWCVLFFIFGHSSPAVHPTITKEERQYIEASLGQTKDNQVVPTPWIKILTSIHFYAILIANIGSAWGYAMIMTQGPTYLAKVMKFDMTSNGLVSALPYIAGALSGFVIAPLADWIIKKKYLSKLNVRRFAQLISGCVQTLCLLLLAYVVDTQFSSVFLLSVANAANSAGIVGYSVNYVDLSPRFSGIMQGIGNTASQIISIFSPLLVQFIVKDQYDATQWRTIFLVAAIMYSASSIFYVIFTSVVRQKWDGPSTEAVDKMERMKKASFVSITGY